VPNSASAGTPPQIPLGSLQRSTSPLSLIKGLLLRGGEGTGRGGEWKRKGGDEKGRGEKTGRRGGLEEGRGRDRTPSRPLIHISGYAAE